MTTKTKSQGKTKPQPSQSKLDLEAVGKDKNASGYLLSMLTALYACVYTDSVKPLEFFLKKRSEGSWKSSLTKKAILLALQVLIKLLSDTSGIKSKQIKKIGLTDRIKSAVRKTLGVKKALRSGIALESRASQCDDDTPVFLNYEAFEDCSLKKAAQRSPQIGEVFNHLRYLDDSLGLKLECQAVLESNTPNITAGNTAVAGYLFFDSTSARRAQENQIGLFNKNQKLDWRHAFFLNDDLHDILESKDINPFDYYMSVHEVIGDSIFPTYQRDPYSNRVPSKEHDAVQK